MTMIWWENIKLILEKKKSTSVLFKGPFYTKIFNLVQLLIFI